MTNTPDRAVVPGRRPNRASRRPTAAILLGLGAAMMHAPAAVAALSPKLPPYVGD